MSARRPWWWTFTDIELSMLASHLAAGGTFCCKHGEPARRAVTENKGKLAKLEDHAYDSWGCWRGEFAGQGPYLRANGKPWDKKFAKYLHDAEIQCATRFLEEFFSGVSGTRAWSAYLDWAP